MRIAIISDIHGNSVALEAVIHDIQQQKIESVIFLGDLVMLGPEPRLVINMLQELKPICWVKGNTDIWFEEMSCNWKPGTEKEIELYEYYLYARNLLNEEEIALVIDKPYTEAIEIIDQSILCVHGSPRAVNEIMDHRTPREHLMQMLEEVKEDIVVCGHSHVPYIEVINGKYLFNVGSVGKPLDGDNRAAYGIVSIQSGGLPEFEIRRINYPISEALKLAKDRNFPFLAKYMNTLHRGLL
ncbi:MAG: metallophosphoesterase family protein [Clostridia bacterium]